VPTIPTLKSALGAFGPVPAPPPLPVATDAPFILRPATPGQLDELSFEFLMSSQDLYGLLYSPGEMNLFRDALTAVLHQPITTAHIRPVAQNFSNESPEVQELLNELSLVLPTRTVPAKLSFQADYRPF
jgi:hypothetical protein